MKQVLSTELYNQFYYDFLTGSEITKKYLPSFDANAVEEACRQIAPVTTIHAEVKKILAKQNADYQSEKVKASVSKLSDPKCMVIITGQQLGLLLSPIYTIYKAMTTVKLADQMNGMNTGHTFIPVFWLETEDHDFEEIRHAGIWDRNMQPLQISYDGRNQVQMSVRHYQLEDKIHNTLEKLQQEMLPTEFTKDLFKRIDGYYRSGRSWTAATLDLFREIFSETGMLFFEPGTGEIKSISVAFFKDWTERIGTVGQAFSKQSRRLESDGYSLQVPDIPGKTFMHFEDDDLQRHHIYHEDGSFYLKDRSERWTIEDLKVLLRDSPNRFSTAVASRPVLQSWLLPVAAYVAGPAEIAYWAQLREIFHVMSVAFPVVYPRLSATLIEPKIQRYIDKHKADVTGAVMKMKEFVDDYFAKNQFDRTKFKKWRSEISGTFAQITDYITTVDATLVPVAEKTGQRIEGQIEQLESRLLNAVEQKEKTLLNHLEQIHTALYPLEHPQERFISIIYFLNKFGPGFLGQLMKGMNLEPKHHQILSL